MTAPAPASSSTLSREEISQLVRDTVAQSVAQVVPQAVQQVVQSVLNDVTTRKSAPVSFPEDVGVSIPENPDEKSTTESVNKSNWKNAGEMPAFSAASLNQLAVISLRDAIDFRRRMDEQILHNSGRDATDEREAVRNHYSRNNRCGEKHDQNVMETSK